MFLRKDGPEEAEEKKRSKNLLVHNKTSPFVDEGAVYFS